MGIEGSNAKNRYYVSLGYYDGEGMQHNDDYEKYTVDMSYDNQVARNVLQQRDELRLQSPLAGL